MKFRPVEAELFHADVQTDDAANGRLSLPAAAPLASVRSYEWVTLTR
jgi:hypothetical protein